MSRREDIKREREARMTPEGRIAARHRYMIAKALWQHQEMVAAFTEARETVAQTKLRLLRSLSISLESWMCRRWLQGEISTRDLEWVLYIETPDDSPYWQQPHWWWSN